MTDTERAIKHFQNVRDGAVVVLDSFGHKPNESPTLYKRRKLNAEVAISALEKQLPKKVIFEPDEGVPDCCICPRCGFDMMGVYDFTDNNTKDPPFCPECGQALDWGDK